MSYFIFKIEGLRIDKLIKMKKLLDCDDSATTFQAGACCENATIN